MRKKTWKPYVWGILFVKAVGALSGWLSRDGMKLYTETVTQPPLSPPLILFPIIWGILYALMGISAARIYLSPPSPARSRGLNLFVLQLVLNFFWSLIFFNTQAFLLPCLCNLLDVFPEASEPDPGRTDPCRNFSALLYSGIKARTPRFQKNRGVNHLTGRAGEYL